MASGAHQDQARTFVCFSLLALCCSLVSADIYMQNPRGSNNRLTEATRERANGNRMFDSQNNERGGYNVGQMYYYEGSKLMIEWTNQHACKSGNSHCELILQYMCADTVRDGTTTKTIPEVNSQCANNDCNSDVQYGMNEDNVYYATCKRRNRNKGLFVADQNVGPRAINTRQNPNGQRSGYECPEERDYYPYWHPTSWIDIAILTNDMRTCATYRNESENVKGRWYCAVPLLYQGVIPNNQAECEKLVVGSDKNDTAQWKLSSAHNVNPPHCQEAQFTRDNHLGNTLDGNMPSFNWTIPNTPHEHCVLRLRYNISTNDYNRADTFGNGDKPTTVPLATKMGLSEKDAQNRGYVFKQNPKVQIFSDIPNAALNLAINTNQYGRVFQGDIFVIKIDFQTFITIGLLRSHTFAIRKRPSELAGKNIVNLNVRGKRGNIVQVYPAVEYDFVPNKLEVSKTDYVHIQWTGSNTNPNNNDGQGIAGSDRNNIVLLGPPVYTNKVARQLGALKIDGEYGVNYPTHLDNTTFLGFSRENLVKMALLHQFGGSMDELNDAGTYFDLDPVQITSAGVVHYMCTRNNNFSNRDQKGEIISYENVFQANNIGYYGGTLEFTKGSVRFEEGSLMESTYVRIDSKPREQIMSDSRVTDNQQALNLMDRFEQDALASEFVTISPSESFAVKPFRVDIPVTNPSGLLEESNVYRISADFSVMTKWKADIDERGAHFDTTFGGTYVIRNDKNYTVFTAVLVSVVLLLTLVVIVAIYLYKNPKFLQRFRYVAANFKRSTESQI